MQRPEWVVFDMDGVLCRLDDAARLGYLARVSGRRAEEIRRAIWGSGFEDAADAGEYSAEEYLAGFGERIGYGLSRAEWVAYRRAGTVPDERVLEVARGLRGRVKLAVLTNNGFLLKETIGEVFQALQGIFGEHVYASAEFGVRKPDGAVYRALGQRLGAGEVLFFDDNAANVAGAVEAGWRARQYREIGDLTGCLEEFAL